MEFINQSPTEAYFIVTHISPQLVLQFTIHTQNINRLSPIRKLAYSEYSILDFLPDNTNYVRIREEPNGQRWKILTNLVAH